MLPAWLSDPFWAKVALIGIQVWLGFPFVFALFTGVLQSISSDWYEAADMDGASSWQSLETSHSACHLRHSAIVNYAICR